MIRIKTIPNFDRAYKKLRPNQKTDVDAAIRAVVANPDMGESKKGNLASLRVYKFSMARQQALLGYSYVKDELIVILIAVGPHENFYRDLKKRH